MLRQSLRSKPWCKVHIANNKADALKGVDRVLNEPAKNPSNLWVFYQALKVMDTLVLKNLAP